MWFKNPKNSRWHKRKFYHDQYAICNATHERAGHLNNDNPPLDQRCKVCQSMLGKKGV